MLHYRFVADAIEAPPEARNAILRAVAADEHLGRGHEREMRASLRTLQRWVARYEKDKLKGLMRPERSDKGKMSGLSDAALARIIALRKEEPSRSTPTLIDIVERSGEVAVGALRRSTLDRHLDKQSASRRMMRVLGQKRHVRLSLPCPLDFVVGDFHAGPYICTDAGDVRRTELEAFIDHHTSCQSAVVSCQFRSRGSRTRSALCPKPKTGRRTKLATGTESRAVEEALLLLADN